MGGLLTAIFHMRSLTLEAQALFIAKKGLLSSKRQKGQKWNGEDLFVRGTWADLWF